MTRIFTEDGVSIPVTVIEVEANRVTQVKDLANDGYRAIQVTTGAKKANRVTKPEAGHFAKAGVEAGRGLWEFRLAEGEEFTVGQSISVELFAGKNTLNYQLHPWNNCQISNYGKPSSAPQNKRVKDKLTVVLDLIDKGQIVFSKEFFTRGD